MLVGLSVGFLYWRASSDIVRRQEAEKALQNSEERYRTIYNRAPAMLHSIDTEGRLVMVSDHWLETLGYERQEVIGRKVTDFFSEASRALRRRGGLPRFLPERFLQGHLLSIPQKERRTHGGPAVRHRRTG